MFKLNSKKTVSDKVKGLFAKPIPYEVRVLTGDWSPYFGQYQNQKWGDWDSDSCWALSAINCAEDQLEWLWKNNQFSQEAKDFFIKNGYVDEDGDFSLSERFLEVLSGVKDNGNNQMEAWVLMQRYGCIPRQDLTYTKERAQSFNTQLEFERDYFNIFLITDEMKAKGQMFLDYVNVARKWIGTLRQTPKLELLEASLKQAPLQIGIPANSFTWNKERVIYDGSKSADHAVELYAIDYGPNGTNEYLIFDQYEPHLKRLSSDYYLPIVSQGILYAIPQEVNPVSQVSLWARVWSAVFAYLQG